MKLKGITRLAILMALCVSQLLYAAPNPLLKSVPADTILFSGNLEVIHLSDYPMISFSPDMEAPLGQSEREELEPELLFFYELYVDFLKVVSQGTKTFQQHYGLAEQFSSVFYTLGASPVLKLTLDDPQAFLSALDRAEKHAGFQHTMASLAQDMYRSYPVGERHELIVHLLEMENSQVLATVAVLNRSQPEQVKRLLFDIDAPAQALSDTDKLLHIQQKHQYLPLSVNFIDFQALLASLFQQQNNPWIAMFGDDEQVIAELQASGCEQDIRNITQDMPGIVGGYRQYQTDGQRVTMGLDMLLELNNQEVKHELNQFRGFIPAFIRNGAQDNLFALAIGANLSQLTPMFLYVSKVFKESNFTCEPLVELKQEIAQMNPASIALMTGMADGVKGISLALQDFKIKNVHQGGDETQPVQPVIDISMILGMVAENPVRVWQMMSAFVPEIATIIPSEQPQKLQLAELEPYGVDLYVKTKGQQLVLYTGEQASTMAETMLDEAVVNNGFFQETVNYSRLTSAVSDLRDYMTSAESPEQLPAESCIYFDETLTMLSRMSGFVDIQSDFVQYGWLNSIVADLTIVPSSPAQFALIGQFETYTMQDGCQLALDGIEMIRQDGSGFYQQLSDDGQCAIFETEYHWSVEGTKMNLQYVSERSRPEGLCDNEFDAWAIPEPDYINDVCQLRAVQDGEFACLYQWEDSLMKSVFKRI
jgi:hypothetical protein